MTDVTTAHLGAEPVPEWQSRSALLLGAAALTRLRHCHVLLLGTGGVGGHAAESLVRAGVGELTLVDGDTVQLSNLNRQFVARIDVLNQPKVTVLAELLLRINPALKLHTEFRMMSREDAAPYLEAGKFDLLLDAIDDIPAKCAFLAAATARHIPVVSSMGAGAKRDLSQLQCLDLAKTRNCRLAKAVRMTLRKEYGITKGIRCVFSDEPPCVAAITPHAVGTVSYMTAAFGLYCAAAALDALIGQGDAD